MNVSLNLYKNKLKDALTNIYTIRFIGKSGTQKSGGTNMAIWEFLAERLADYEIPRGFVVLNRFP